MFFLENKTARLLGRIAVILLAGGGAFFPAVRGGWLWDDAPEITGNPLLRDLPGLAKIWFAPGSSDYFPLKTTVEWGEWHLWGNHPAGYHLVTLGLHLLGALLVWRLFAKLGLRLAWLGGLLFAVHPLTVESVAWIAELKNTLSLAWLLLAMIYFVDFDAAREAKAGRLPLPVSGKIPRRENAGNGTRALRSLGEGGRQRFAASRRDAYVCSLACFIAAMLCKTSVVMLPGIILLYCWWRRGRIGRGDVVAAAPFFAVSLLLGAVTVWFQHHHVIVPLALRPESWATRVGVAGRAIVFYFWKSVVPVGLLPIYPRWPAAAPALWPWGPWVLIFAILAGLWTKRATWGRHALLGLGFFLLNLVPVLGFFPMAYQRISWVADHLAYVPLVGLLGVAVAGAGVLTAKAAQGVRWGGAICAAAIGLLLLLQSNAYSKVFHDQETLWTYTLARNPDAWFAHANLAGIYLEQGRVQETIAQCEWALRLKPDDALTHCNLGAALGRVGRVPEAIAEYEEALRLRPDFYAAEYNLAVTLRAVGRTDEAKAHFARAAELQAKR